jgi:VIT1/CCC1 family predicted Fe2+/Mn2+ transporter
MNDIDSQSVASSSTATSTHWRDYAPSHSTMSTTLEDVDEKQGLMMRSSQDSNNDDSSHYQKKSYINPDVVRDIIIGLSDGLTVPFALTAGLSGLDNSKIVVLGGLAELVSGAISMGVGGMLSAKAELDHYKHTEMQTAERVESSRTLLLQEEIQSIFTPLGLSVETSARIAAELYQVEEDERREHLHRHQSLPLHTSNSNTQARSHNLAFVPCRGLTPLLVRMGEGLEEIDHHRVWQSAFTIGLSYFIGGFIPLLPYLVFDSVSTALFASAVITAVVLLVFGVVKQRCTGLSDWRSLTKSAISTLAVGAAAAGSSWAIVWALEK